MTRSRRLLTIACVTVVVITALAPATTDLPYAVLVALDPLFGGLGAAAISTGRRSSRSRSLPRGTRAASCRGERR